MTPKQWKAIAPGPHRVFLQGIYPEGQSAKLLQRWIDNIQPFLPAASDYQTKHRECVLLSYPSLSQDSCPLAHKGSLVWFFLDEYGNVWEWPTPPTLNPTSLNKLLSWGCPWGPRHEDMKTTSGQTLLDNNWRLFVLHYSIFFHFSIETERDWKMTAILTSPHDFQRTVWRGKVRSWRRTRQWLQSPPANGNSRKSTITSAQFQMTVPHVLLCQNTF